MLGRKYGVHVAQAKIRSISYVFGVWPKTYAVPYDERLINWGLHAT